MVVAVCPGLVLFKLVSIGAPNMLILYILDASGYIFLEVIVAAFLVTRVDHSMQS